MKKLMFIFTLLLFPFIAMAGLDSVWPVLGPVIIGYAGEYPVIFKIVMYMGSARLVMKPLMSTVLVIIDLTPTTKDNLFMEKLKNYWWYKSLVYLLDWSLSIKLPVKK